MAVGDDGLFRRETRRIVGDGGEDDDGSAVDDGDGRHGDGAA